MLFCVSEMTTTTTSEIGKLKLIESACFVVVSHLLTQEQKGWNDDMVDDD